MRRVHWWWAVGVLRDTVGFVQHRLPFDIVRVRDTLPKVHFLAHLGVGEGVGCGEGASLRPSPKCQILPIWVGPPPLLSGRSAPIWGDPPPSLP